MKKLNSIQDVENALESEAVLLYITSPNCSVCEVLKPKTEDLIKTNFPKILTFEADVSEIPELGAKFNVFSAPAILIFFDKREFIREGRNVSLELLREKIEKIYNLYYG